MYYFSSFPFLRMTPPLALGICAYIYIQPYWVWFVIPGVLGLAYSLTDLLFTRWYRHYHLRCVSGITHSLVLFSLGVVLCRQNDIQCRNDYFGTENEIQAFHGYLEEIPVEKEKSWKSTFHITEIRNALGWKNASGKILVYIKKQKNFQPRLGDEFVFTGKPQIVQPPLNPGQFDYKQYLGYHGIYHRLFLDSSHIQKTGRHPMPLFAFAADLRQQLLSVFYKLGLQGNEYAVASALVLGVTDQLDPVMVRAYASTGALHVLSVSGLHVGVIYLMLQFVFSFFGRGKRSKLTQSLLILLIIWFYALLTGLSPSVLRSATMFSFITIGTIINRKGNVYNSIAASAFVLLCINPYIIMQVGFQLSYLAVLGIVYLYPKIYSRWYFSNKAIDKIWSITAVSVSAQLMTFPLGLLYYHQFPNYFFLSNLVVIPVGALILYTGVATLVLSAVPFINAFLALLLYYEIWFLNQSVIWVEKLPYALYEGISIGITETWLIYVFCAAGTIALQYRKPRYIFPSLLCLTALFTMQFTEVNRCTQQQKLIIYQTPGAVAIDAIHGRRHTFISENTFYEDKNALLFYVKHNWDNLHLRQEEFIPAFNPKSFSNELILSKGPMLVFSGKKMLLVNDTTRAWEYARYAPFDLVVVYGNPKLNIKKLAGQMKFDRLILAGKHRFYKQKYWMQDAKDAGIPVHEINKQGAFIWDMKAQKTMEPQKKHKSTQMNVNENNYQEKPN